MLHLLSVQLKQLAPAALLICARRIWRSCFVLAQSCRMLAALCCCTFQWTSCPFP